MIRWVLWTALVLLVWMTLLRLAFFLYFNNQGNSGTAIWQSFVLGLRFDLRAVSVIGLVSLVFSAIPFFSPFKSKTHLRIWNLKMGFICFVFVLFYFVDLAHYAYLSQRMNATVLNYLADANISATMVWQSYPIIRILLVLVVATWALSWVLRKGYRTIYNSPKQSAKPVAMVMLVLLMAGFSFGRLNQYPLRWSDAFGLGSDYQANLALNPFESFFNTLKFRSVNYDEKTLAADRAFLKPYYGWENGYERIQGSDSAKLVHPNIVVVICESYSAYKSSMVGNPLNTTPFFDSLSKQGWYFDRCFTPTYGTARGVWATLTGLPDVELQQTASRNPAAVNQNVIMNQFKGYEKYYFIGGSPSWANIRGVLSNNIEGLHLYEEENLKSPRLDVWGISDKNLFLEANGILSKEQKPFIAVIQTADNHRPYSIPDEDTLEFKRNRPSEAELDANGFKDQVNYEDKLKEYNAFRYTDFTFQKFIQAAQKEAYFKNTIFVFVGDHGIPGDVGKLLPQSWTTHRLTSEHVPLLFYGPAFVQPKREARMASQVDLMATVADLAGMKVRNTGLGRSLKDSTKADFAFIFNPETRQIGVVRNGYFYRETLKTNQWEIVSVIDNSKAPDSVLNGNVKNELQQLTRSLYNTASYLLTHNKK